MPSTSFPVLTCLGCAVNVLYGESCTEPIQQDFGEGWDELGGGYQHVHAVGPTAGHRAYVTTVGLLAKTTRHSNCDQPGVDERQGFERLRQPQVGENLHLPPQLEPLLSLRAAQQTCSAKCGVSLF